MDELRDNSTRDVVTILIWILVLFFIFDDFSTKNSHLHRIDRDCSEFESLDNMFSNTDLEEECKVAKFESVLSVIVIFFMGILLSFLNTKNFSLDGKEDSEESVSNENIDESPPNDDLASLEFTE
jgi:hypothetical protein